MGLILIVWAPITSTSDNFATLFFGEHFNVVPLTPHTTVGIQAANVASQTFGRSRIIGVRDTTGVQQLYVRLNNIYSTKSGKGASMA